MNKIFNYLPFIAGGVFVIFLILALPIVGSNPFFNMDKESDNEERSYHYVFFLPESDFDFFKKIKEGILNAADSLDCAVTFHGLNSQSLQAAPYLGVDGIGIYPYEKNKLIISSLAKIAEAGIPVIQIENEVLRDESTFYIGTNNFETGKAIGKMAESINFADLFITLVYSDKNPGLFADRNLMEMGILSELKGRKVHIQTEKTSQNPLDAERLAYRLMRQDGTVDLIVLTAPSDTLVTVQAIIDMNKVGQVAIIGFGDDVRIREYIEKRIVLGTIFRNPERIGYNAVMTLTELANKGYTSAYVDTGINIIMGAE